MAQEVDFVVIGAGLAGLTAAHLLPGTTRVIDPSPGAYKIGESVAPEQFQHPALRQLLPRIQRLPSYTPKHGVTFMTADEAAHFPLSTDDEPGAMHVARHELEDLLRRAWDIDVVTERVVRVVPDEGIVDTDGGRWRARQLVVDASGPAMLVAHALGGVQSLGTIAATWRYFRVAARDDAAMLANARAQGLSLRRYDARRKQLLAAGDWDRWRPSLNTLLRSFGDGRWCWQIPIHGGDILSFGVVQRGEEAPDDEAYDAIVAEHTAPCFRLDADAELSAPYDRRRRRRAFARRARHAAGPKWALLGDAFAFADPVYSVGTAIAVNQAVALAASITADGWTEATARAFDARGQALLGRCRRAFDFWYSGELLAAPAAATEVHDGFIYGHAFTGSITQTYGDALENASLRTGAHRDPVQIPEGGPALAAPQLTGPQGWQLTDARPCTDGVKTHWAHDDGTQVDVYALRDPDARAKAYARTDAIAWYYEGVSQPTVVALMDALVADVSAWRDLLADARASPSTRPPAGT